MQGPEKKLPLLSDEETKRLIARAQAGDTGARDYLVNCNLRLVRSLVGRFAHRQVEMEDLFQLGCLGLIRAIDRFDLSQNVRFSTYAVPLILGEIRRYLRDNGPIKVSRSLKELAARARREQESLSTSLGREVTIEELASALDVEAETLVLALEATSTPASLQSQIYQDDGNPIYLIDHLTDEPQPDEAWTDNIALQTLIGQLAPREQTIIQMRYFQGKTQTEVAKCLNVSQVQISRLEKKILQKLRASLGG
ncbi:MAG: RNA polymerase sporulation sigma factor, SigF/SigG family [Firmicutes bacterium]|nr:RNA polymerase sporulation sigma factor, SigF/SigG family [Bacillota bacterium]